MLLDLTELSSYLPLVSSFEFGNVSGDGGPRLRTTMTSAGIPPCGGLRRAVFTILASATCVNGRCDAKPGGALTAIEGPHGAVPAYVTYVGKAPKPTMPLELPTRP